VNQSLRNERSFRRFEPSTLAFLSARSPASRRAEGAHAAYAAASPLEALVARFPVICSLVGDESFRAMAQRFMVSEPPRFTGLRRYGDAFPDFLRRLGDTASFAYVADIAELEMVLGKARGAADALPMDAKACSLLQAEKHHRLRLVLHPSVFLVASRFPIVTIWENNKRDGENTLIERWRAEAALVARPFHDVEVRRLPAGGHAFLSALSEGHTIATAVEVGSAAAADFDVAANLAVLIEANIVVGVREDA
jgi:hypothetical protein